MLTHTHTDQQTLILPDTYFICDVYVGYAQYQSVRCGLAVRERTIERVLDDGAHVLIHIYENTQHYTRDRTLTHTHTIISLPRN